MSEVALPQGPTNAIGPWLESAYGLRPDRVVPAKGTAGRTWRAEVGGRSYFIRRRGARTSSEARLRFDHGLRQHLATRGTYVTPALTNVDGAPWTTRPDGVYEVYPWVEGLAFAPRVAARARDAAAAVLAWFHREAVTYSAACEPLVPQFGHFPVPIPPRPRFDDPAVLQEAMAFVVANYATVANRSELTRAQARLAAWADAYAGPRQRLPLGVIHGDFNHCNALYSHDGAIIGLFDFDWAWRDARVRDVGDALFFFGACRSDPPDAGDIWSLTACPRLDTNSMLCFLHRYDSLAPLAVEEWAAVPLAMLGRWVAIRLEGVMKVPESRRAEFVLAGFERPFAWFDEVRNAWAQARYRRPGG